MAIPGFGGVVDKGPRVCVHVCAHMQACVHVCVCVSKLAIP